MVGPESGPKFVGRVLNILVCPPDPFSILSTLPPSRRLTCMIISVCQQGSWKDILGKEGNEDR